MKIEKFHNKKEDKDQYRTRFQLNNQEYRLTADTRKELTELVDELRGRARRTRLELPVEEHSPLVKELFDKYLLRISGDRKRKAIFERVSKKLLKLLPEGLEISGLKKAHFQKYIDLRGAEKNNQNERFILPETINKELSAISSALKTAPLLFTEMEDLPAIEIPKAKTKKNRRREKIVEKNEFALLLAELRKPHINPAVETVRRHLADDLEIKYETGFRRKEIAQLRVNQYSRNEAALRDVRRFKTGTVTKFFPLTTRAVEIIESRLTENADAEFIFSKNGKPSESSYRTLKKLCADLGIPYGTFTEGGFVPHDLRHNFATEIIQVTDIETAKSLTGHTGQHILTYLHTNEERQRKAMRRREGIDLIEGLTALYNDVKNGNLELQDFIKRVQNLTKK